MLAKYLRYMMNTYGHMIIDLIAKFVIIAR